MGTFLITGAGGYLAGRLTEYLLGWEGCDRLIGLDVKPQALGRPGVDWSMVDIRDEETTRIIASERPDVIVHTAFAVDFLHRTKEVLGFNPAYTSRDAFVEAVRIRADILGNMGRRNPENYRIFNAMLNLELRKQSK